MTHPTYDLLIIGGGPAGAASAVYAARKRLKTVIITKNWDGQSAVSERIENWVGTPAISGAALSQALRDHVFSYKSQGLETIENDTVTYIKKKRDHFEITTAEGMSINAMAVIIASGSSRRKLTVPGSDRFENKGIVYCASCDGPLFAGMDVVVVGGGNAAFETAAQLEAYAKSVTMLIRGDIKADAVTVDRIKASPIVTIIQNVDIESIAGESFVQSISYKDKTSEKITELPVQGVFVEIGSLPNTDFAADLVKRDQINRIVINPKNQRTSRHGIWAAGDCTDGLYQQNNIAAGDAVKALEDCYMWLHSKNKRSVDTAKASTDLKSE